MSINKGHLRELIREVLSPLGWWSESAEELLMLTAAVESDLGTYLRQEGGGEALGIFQMEPRTHDDIWVNWLKYKQEYADKVVQIMHENSDPLFQLKGDLTYQIVMARLQYLRVPKPLPAATDIRALASYHKKYYNTVKGKATVIGSIKKYNRLVLE